MCAAVSRMAVSMGVVSISATSISHIDIRKGTINRYKIAIVAASTKILILQKPIFSRG